MSISRGLGFIFLTVFFIVLSFGSGGNVYAQKESVAVVNMQKVLAKSKVGQSAQQIMESKIKGLQASFKKDEEELVALQKEIEKKSSAWNEEVKQEKAIEFQKKRRDLNSKREDAKLEISRLREQQYGPILKVLEQVVTDVANAKGYTVVLPRASVIFAGDSVDITDDIVKALDEAKK